MKKLLEGSIGRQDITDEQFNEAVDELMEQSEAYMAESLKEPPEIIRVYEGYYFSYNFVPNGRGGYHPVNLTFNHDEKGLHKQITDEIGRFLEFPGVTEGPWRQDLKHPFREQMEFVFNTGRPSDENALLDFHWTVQPDGQYYADEDGFGMENDEEIVLVTGMDRQGRFTGPFHESG